MGVLRNLLFGGKELHEGCDVIGRKNRAKGRHPAAAIANLTLDLVFVQAFADRSEVGAQVGSTGIGSVAVLAATIVKERGTSVPLVVLR